MTVRYAGVAWSPESLAPAWCALPPSGLVWARWGSRAPGHAVHGFVDDWRFQCLFRSGRVPPDVLGREWATAPDCSLWAGMPPAVVEYQVYRSRLAGALLSRAGLNVVPVLRWATWCDPRRWRWGIASGSVVAVRAPGGNSALVDDWKVGYASACRWVSPSLVLVFGCSARVRGALDDAGVEWRAVPLRRAPPRR